MKEKESEWIIEGLIKKDAVNMVNIAHDDWCDFLKDEPKECNCNPDISSEVLNEE